MSYQEAKTAPGAPTVQAKLRQYGNSCAYSWLTSGALRPLLEDGVLEHSHGENQGRGRSRPARIFSKWMLMMTRRIHLWRIRDATSARTTPSPLTEFSSSDNEIEPIDDTNDSKQYQAVSELTKSPEALDVLACVVEMFDERNHHKTNEKRTLNSNVSVLDSMEILRHAKRLSAIQLMRNRKRKRVGE